MKNTFSRDLGGKTINLYFLQIVSKDSIFFNVPDFYPVCNLDDFKRIRGRLIPGKRYAVRSSGVSEDSQEQSMAGQFQTVLNVTINDIPHAISHIQAHSSQKTGEIIPVVIQEMVEDTVLSGVAFSYDIDTDRPYSVIQFHEGIGEDIVSGQITGETFRIMNGIPHDEIESYVPDRLQAIYRTIQELQNQYYTQYFDIEFAIDTSGQLHLLQIRPLTTVSEKPNEVSPLSYRYARRIAHSLRESGEIFGDMIDINPRELVGGEPKIVQTLFQYLFADGAIPETRREMGYNVGVAGNLSSSFNGNLYINLEEDLRAFLPAELPEDDVLKFLHYYKNLLRVNPDAQNRLDSELYPITREKATEIIYLIYPQPEEQARVLGYFLNLFERLETFLGEKFSSYAVLENDLLNQLGVRNYFELIQLEENPNLDNQDLIQLAIRIAREFASYARGAFYYSQFESSDPRVFTRLLYQSNIFRNLSLRGMSRIPFRQITGFNLLKIFETHFSQDDAPVFEGNAIGREGSNKIELFLAARENLKFVLMRVLYLLGQKLLREGEGDLEKLDFRSFMGVATESPKGKSVSNAIPIIFPGVLSGESTPICHRVSNAGGYFIGNGILEGEVVYANDVAQLAKMNGRLQGKILVIDHATPEIDGVLGQVKGVITRIGGPLAHIAIRAREMKIPSVVGVSSVFERIKKGASVRIDFDNQLIHVI